jgi:hypothetical protein
MRLLEGIVLLVMLNAAAVWAGDARPAGCDADELWMISTRHLGYAAPSDSAPALRVRRCTAEGWQASTLDKLLEPAPDDVVHVIYVHGNQVDPSDAISRVRKLRWQLTADEDSRPVRVVLWSWPSSKIRGPLNDYRTKAGRTSSESYYLGWFLQHYATDSDVSLVGFSLGGRIITGSLQLLDGGTLAGRRLAELPPRRKVRVAMWAAAVDNQWLHSGRPHGRAVQGIDAMLNIYNTCDPALKRFRLVEKCGSPDAAGYCGFAGAPRLRQQGLHLEQRNAAGIVGKAHDELRYLCSGQLMSHVRRYALWAPVDEAHSLDPPPADQPPAPAAVPLPSPGDAVELSAL